MRKITTALLALILTLGLLLLAVSCEGDPMPDTTWFTQIFVGSPTTASVTSNRDGGIMASEAIRSEAAVTAVTYDGGIGLWISEYGTLEPDHSGTGSFDLTGGAYENLFTSTTPIFEQSDADERKFVVIQSEDDYGRAGEIVQYINASNVVLQTWGWTSDFTTAAYVLIVHPLLGIGDGGHITFHARSIGNFEVESANYTNGALVTSALNSGSDGNTGILAEILGYGYSDVTGIEVEYTTGNISTGAHGVLIELHMDETGADSSNTSTEVDFLEFLTTDENDLQKHAIHVGQGFDSAVTVAGGIEEDPDYGYSVVPDTATDRVNGGAPGGTAFLEASAGDVEIFSSDDDYILIGSDAMFETIEVVLVSGANQPVLPEFYFSTGEGTWDTLVVTETTNGFTHSGVVAFNAPALWATSNATVPAGTVIDAAYYVKIVRTRNNLGSPPVEDYFKTFTSSSLTDFEIRGDGTIRPVEMADASASNNSLYYSTDQSKLVYKDSGGTVRDLW